MFRFQEAIKKYGVPQEEIFQTADLFERRNIPQVTLCLYALGRIVSTSCRAWKRNWKKKCSPPCQFGQLTLLQGEGQVDDLSLYSNKMIPITVLKIKITLSSICWYLILWIKKKKKTKRNRSKFLGWVIAFRIYFSCISIPKYIAEHCTY